MTRLHVRAALSFLLVVLHHAQRPGFARSTNYNNPKFFKIGGVLSNDESKAHFEKTIAVRECKLIMTIR